VTAPEAIGIRVNVASTSFAVLRRDFLQLRRYDAAIAVWEQGPDPDPYFAWHSSQTGPEGLNLANFAHLVSDELISEARVANDDVTRRDFYGQFQDIWQEQVPSVIIAYPESVYATPESLARTEVGILFDGTLRFRGIEAWQQ
jgi:ABC-type transport system substrate-binding protein